MLSEIACKGFSIEKIVGILNKMVSFSNNVFSNRFQTHRFQTTCFRIVHTLPQSFLPFERQKTSARSVRHFKCFCGSGNIGTHPIITIITPPLLQGLGGCYKGEYTVLGFTECYQFSDVTQSLQRLRRCTRDEDCTAGDFHPSYTSRLHSSLAYCPYLSNPSDNY